MATCLPSHSFFTPRLSAPPQRSSKTLVLKTPALQPLHHFPLCRPLTEFPLLNFSPVANRRCFNVPLAAEEPSPFTIDEAERSQNGAKTSESETEKEGSQNDAKTSESKMRPGHLSSLKTLTEAYKEAIIDGDEKTIAEIEAMIYTLENEKNDLAQKVSTLSSEITSGKDKYLRLQADFDNFRKRSEKERLTTRTDAKGEVIESLLLMVDNFERAKQQIKPETEKEKNIDTSYQGIYKQFVEIMKSLNVSAVETVGKPFDPSLHEAMAREESQEFREGIVIQEFRRGFFLGDRLLRPAMVKVSAGPGRKKTTSGAEKSDGQPATAAGVDEDASVKQP
ncbi:uncharacterized protein LOC131162021 [Malania oleifera]|uniref:uncharacterized protein LOC131162021 n=1 Tax=Malania oleifera TaxID=397392 RepID=UPI0025ADD5AF|nr:uncharacterized protein LOC131162021 [Malania oleifera]